MRHDPITADLAAVAELIRDHFVPPPPPPAEDSDKPAAAVSGERRLHLA